MRVRGGAIAQTTLAGATDEPPEPIYDHWSPPISKLDWHGASIDLEHGWLILAGDKLLRADVEINADDLRYGSYSAMLKRSNRRQRRSALPVREIADLDPSRLEATKRAIRDDLAAGRRYSKCNCEI